MHLLTIQEVAEILRVTNSRAYEMARTGLLPGVVRLGRQIRVNKVALDEFIRNGGQALPGGWKWEA
ncbi:MAG: helix-turn-helix domain-containing protein [Bacillota bacterium]